MVFTQGVGQMWGADIVIDLDLSDAATYPVGFPNSSTNPVVTTGTYTFGGYSFSFFAPVKVFRFSTQTPYYLAINGVNNTAESNAGYIEFPAIANYKLTEVILTSTSGGSTQVGFSIRSNYSTTLTGGAQWTNVQNSSHTWTLSGTAANTAYRLYVVKTSGSGSKNGQVKGLKLTYEPTAVCANSVAVSDGGSSTHGSITSITTSPVATCSSTAADRHVSIVVTPSNGYTAPTDLSVGTKTGTVTSTKVSRTDNYNGTFTFVYRYNQNDNGSISYNIAGVAKTYTISLNDQTPTTAAVPTSITATYDSNTGLTGTVVTTRPTKTGYTFGGYYTGTEGSGVQLINSDGEIIASASGGGKTYTDASKNWIHSGGVTVYAKWTEKSLTNYRTTCCTDPELAYGTGSVSKTFGEGTFKNTLTNNNGVSVTYGSSVPEVATVASDGTVTIVGAGTTTITASCVQQTISSTTYCADEASYTLTVNKADISPTLTYTPSNVPVEESSNTPTVEGNTGSGTVTYAITSASPAGCATINPSTGVVTGVAIGTITVTATIAASDNYLGGIATATVGIIAASNFPNNRTIFIQAHSSSAWSDANNDCVKAWFHSAGGHEAAQSTYWLFDATGGDAGKKLFAAIVPATGNLPYLDIQRFSHNCNNYKNKNGGCSYADANGSNTIRSTGKSDTDNANDDYIRWNASGVTMNLMSSDAWLTPVASVTDQGAGVWSGTYEYTPSNTSTEYIIATNYNGNIGNTGSNNNVTLSGMTVGSTYNVTATLDIPTHTLTMSKVFVKGTVHFDMQGHGSAISDLTNVTAGSKISAPSPAPSATGWTFGGWYKEPGCTNEWNFASDEVTETMTLYAKWTIKTTTVSFNQNGGDGGQTSSVTATYGEAMPTPITTPTRTGYNFGGYYENSGGAGTQYYTNAGASARTWDKEDATWTLYAKWTAKQAAITFDKNSGSGGDNGTTATYGSAMPTVSVPTRSGYTFGGYYDAETNDNGSGIKYYNANGTSAQNWDKNTESATTLYANWAVINYTITYNLNGGTQQVSPTPATGYTVDDAAITLPTPTREGYDFMGWYANSDLSTGGVQTTIAAGSTGNKEYWAKWQIKNFTVSWKWKGNVDYTAGVSASNNNANWNTTVSAPTAPADNALDVNQGGCLENGKGKFMGWSATNIGSTPDDAPADMFTTTSPAITGNTTFYAVFATASGGGGGAAVNTVMIADDFSDYSNGNQPAAPGGSTTTYASGITYYYSATSNNPTRVLIDDNGPNGSSNANMLVKNGQYYEIRNIPTGNATELTLTLKKAGSGTLSVSSSTSHTTVTTVTTNTEYTISFDDEVETFYLRFNASSNNLRIDDINVKVKTAGISYSDYVTACCTLKPVTGLTVSSVTANSVTLSWTAPSPTTGIDHLELRNASTDAKIGSNIAVGTTSTSVSGLVECNTYSYKVVSVGATCETSSEVIEAQPFSGAKTVTFNYNGGSGSPASFTTSCSGNTVTLPTPDTRAGYTFDGWWTAEFGGVKKGDAGASYTVSGTTTLWAHWSQTNYTVTMAQSPSAGATLTGGTTTAHYGGTINISTTLPSGYRFTGWTASPSVTFADASATSTSFTMPNGNVTVTANFVQVHTLTFVVPTGGGSTITPPATADHGGTVTLPNVTGIAAEYSCETFIGWTTTTPDAEGGTKWSSTPTIKAAGATSATINNNTTFYAVYSRSGGGASGTVELTQSDITGWYTAANAAGTTAYTTQNTYTAGGYTWTAKCQQSQYSSVGRLNLRLRTNANGVSWIQIPTLPGNITTIVCDISKGNNSYTSLSGYNITFQSGTTSGESVIATSNTNDVTTRTIDLTGESYNTGYLTSTYDGTINIHSITVNYGPAPVISHNVACPDCEISQFTLSYDANTSYFPGSTTSCTGVTDYIWANHDDIYTICSTEPTLDGYKFTGWATNANGSGTVYTAGQEISCVPETPLTLYAQYERVYTITFNDMGSATNRTQGAAGASVSVPSATTPCVMAGATWEFAGWSKTGGSLTDAATATIDIAANATEYTPIAADDGQTFYAVYKKTLSGGGSFSVGKSGVYKFYYHYSSSDYWAANKQSTYGIYSTTTAGDAHSFRFTYYPTGTYAGKYTIQNDLGEYIGYSGSSTPLVYNASAADNHYYWTITASGGGFIVQNVQTTTRYLASDGGNYNGKTSANVLSFVAADVVSYYTIMACASTFSITFDDGGGTINWAVGHAQGTYEDVADGTTFSTFPTATFDGWKFIGWTVGQGYSDMSKYSSGRDATTGSGIIFPEAADIYGGEDGTSGNSYTIHSNVTMYPIFTRFEDNEPFDETNGGDYFIYYLADGTNDGYGDNKRVYAGTYDGEKRYSHSLTCEGATTFTFTKLGNGKWTIYDNTTHKYLCDKNDDWLCQQSSPAEWTISVYSGNEFDAYSTHDDYHIMAYDNATGASTATFQNYNKSNLVNNSTRYHRVFLGGCTNRVFSSNPSTTPIIDLKGTAVITSSQNGAVRATNVLTVSGHTLTPSTGTVTITSDNSDIYFSTSASSSFALAAANQPKSSISVTANSSGIVTPTTIYIHYKPSSNVDAWTDVTVTASYTGAEDAEVTIPVRSVKENFVIAAKVADNWYALPANMGAEGVFEPVLIDVDESSKVAYGPATVGYKMWPVQTVNGGTDEYAANGDKVRFAGNSNAGLWASNSNNHIRNWATITAIGSTAETPASYEWIIETEDREAYTLKSMYSTNYLDLYRPSSGAHAGKLVWASNSTYETNEIHFFPLTEREVITIIPREWKANGLVFSVAADNQITAVSYKIGTGSETSTTYTRHSTGGYGLYEVALPDLTSQYGKLLTLKLTISGTPTYATVTIPIIVNANASTKTNEPFATLGAATKDYDVVVLDGKTLTTDAIASGACKFQNLYIYPGATLVNAANNNLSVRYLELRGGIKGIDHKSDLAQGVPHLKLEKNFSSTAGANLDMYVNTAHSYALSVPFDVTLSTVNFANSLNTTTSEPINGALDAQFMIMEYDGEQRASTGKGWKHITSTERVLHAGEGYVLQGKRPKGQPFAVIRFPFSSVSGWADGSGEVTKSAVSISEHAGGASTPDNDKGWNLIANPYMATLSYNGADEGWAANFTVGSLVKTDTDPWDGKYEWTSTTNAYVTMPNEWYSEFPQYRANSAQAVFEPFKNFFIQASANGSVTFDKSLRAAMPRYLMAQANTDGPSYVDINLAHGENMVQAGITVDANATAGYKFGEDQSIFERREDLNYLKLYSIVDGHYLVGNTLTPSESKEIIPLEFFAPDTDDEYVFSMDEYSEAGNFEEINLYDALFDMQFDLKREDYSFSVGERGFVENRFFINMVSKHEDSATGIDGVGDSEHPLKFLYRDKLYILRNGVLYDATGKKVK